MNLQAGFFDFNKRPVPVEQIGAILHSLRVPGHAEPGLWKSDEACLAYADFALRLAAPSPQPYAIGRAAITFDGRLDNRDDLRLILGDASRGDSSDPALALAAYQKYGLDGLVRLIGDWSAAIYDTERKQLVLASDFAGTRSLFYCVGEGKILWSTRLKPLVEWTQPPVDPDEQFVAGFLLRGGSPGRTPYRGVQSVPPGCCLVASRDGIRSHRFWKPPVDSSIRYSRETEYEERLRELFRDAVRCRLLTDFPVLSELSGGLDSSSIACVASRLLRDGAADAPRFVTVSYEHEGSLDRRFYERVGAWCEFEGVRLSTAEHRFVAEQSVGDALPAFWDELRHAVGAEALRIGARTILTGNLGDLIMGNWWDDSAQIAGLLRRLKLAASLRESLAWSKALHRPIYGVLWRALLMALPARMVQSRTELFEESADPSASREDSLTAAFRARTEGDDLFSCDWMEARPEQRKHIHGMCEFLELRRLQAPEPLTHISFTHPFAHRPLVEYMVSIPARIACGPKEPRRLMRRAFRDFWPQELRGRQSKGPFDGVFLDALRPLLPSLASQVEELQMVQRGYVDPAHLKGRLQRLELGQECNGAQLRNLILLELWLRRSRFSGGQTRAAAMP